MPKVTAQVLSTDDELNVTWWHVDWEHAGKCGHFKTALDSGEEEADVLDYFERRAEMEARLQCQET